MSTLSEFAENEKFPLDAEIISRSDPARKVYQIERLLCNRQTKTYHIPNSPQGAGFNATKGDLAI